MVGWGDEMRVNARYIYHMVLNLHRIRKVTCFVNEDFPLHN